MIENYMLELEDRLNAKTKELLFLEAEVQEYHELTLTQTAKIRELKAENAKLRKVAEAAGEFENQYNLDPFIDDVTPGTIAAHRNIRQALAELDRKE